MVKETVQLPKADHDKLREKVDSGFGELKPTSSPGLFPQKMDGAGKGPGIGWSRAKPKYS